MSSEAADLARKYALQNAVRHGGQAHAKAILGKILSERAELRSQAKELGPTIAQVVAEVNALDAEGQRKALEALDPSMLEKTKREQHHGLKHLPDWEAQDEIVLRFAPNPNGPATIGHSRGMVVHAEYQRMYEQEHGKKVTLILRYDDTDPGKKPPVPEAYGALKDDLEWLGARIDRVVYASDRLPVYYEHAVGLIQQGHAYVCTCEAEEFRQLKAAGTSCPCRANDATSNLAGWYKMLDPTMFKPGQAVLRIKTDIKHKDPALRDWVAFRIVDAEHPRTGTQHRVWPLLDFESAIEDHLQGVTHVIRGKDLIDSERKQRFLYDYLNWEYPRTLHWGRVKVHGFGKVSKSVFMEGVASGKYAGWDDVRLPTLAALRRRGFQAAALGAFWVGMGLSEKDIAASLENLEAENTKVVEADADRAFFVPDPVEVRVDGLPHGGVVGSPPVHPDHPGRGKRSLELRSAVLLPSQDVSKLGTGDVVRLKDTGNVRLVAAGSAEWIGDDLEAVKQGATILQWLPAEPESSIPFAMHYPDEEATVVRGRAEAHVAKAVGRVAQFERVGYARVEAMDHAMFAHS